MTNPSQAPKKTFADLRREATLALLASSDRYLTVAAANLAETVRLQETAAARGYHTGRAA